jgi:hypothetical protein
MTIEGDGFVPTRGPPGIAVMVSWVRRRLYGWWGGGRSELGSQSTNPMGPLGTLNVM